MTDPMPSAIRYLGLPLDVEFEGTAAGAVAAALGRAGVSADDLQAALVAWQREWLSGAPARPALKEVVREALQAGGWAYAKRLAPKYHELAELLATQHPLSRQQAAAALGHIELVGALADRHRMSASAIAQLASAATGENLGWRAIQDLLRQLKLLPTLSTAQVRDLLTADRVGEEQVFADARLEESVQVVVEAAAALGVTGIGTRLHALVGPDKGRIHWPYIYILHFALLPLDRYDHLPSFLYEFSPRSDAMTRQLKAAYAGAPLGGNPILNNAKAVDRLTTEWAVSKARKGLHHQAIALAQILEALERLPAPAGRHLAALLRQWCLRLVRLLRPGARPTVPDATADTVKGLLVAVSTGNTSTGGILEQRLIDAVAAALHADPPWRPRGLGDSVNATNVSAKKVGDVEFLDAAGHRIEAFEAHAGVLSGPYLEAHRDSLARVLAARGPELEQVADAAQWKMVVTVVAHEIGTDVTGAAEEIAGFPAAFKAVTFRDLLSGVDPVELVPHFNRLVVPLLRDPRTPPSVAGTYLSLTSL